MSLAEGLHVERTEFFPTDRSEDGQELMRQYLSDTDATGEASLYRPDTYAQALRSGPGAQGSATPTGRCTRARRRRTPAPTSRSPRAKTAALPGSDMPSGVASPPVVILGHGLGCPPAEMRLDAFAERFAQAGIARRRLHVPPLRRQWQAAAPTPVDQATARRLGRCHRLGEEPSRHRRHPNCRLGKLLRRRSCHHRGLASSRN